MAQVVLNWTPKRNRTGMPRTGDPRSHSAVWVTVQGQRGVRESWLAFLSQVSALDKLINLSQPCFFTYTHYNRACFLQLLGGLNEIIQGKQNAWDIVSTSYTLAATLSILWKQKCPRRYRR